MLACVTASIVLPRGFFGFAVFAMGRGPTPDANGGQVVFRVGMYGSAHTDPLSQTQIQCSYSGFCQRCVACLFDKFERSARTAQTAVRLLGWSFWLIAGALF